MVYDNVQRLISRVEHTSNGEVITGFEYTYDALGRMLTEKNLAKNLQICYTYDVLSRVVERASTNLADGTVTKQSYSYDAAGNILSNNDATYVYDTNNRLTAYNEQIIVYDADGNMSSAKLGGTSITLAYDSANRLVSAGECTYTYNAEDTRIRNMSGDYDNIYVYNTNAKLSQLLVRITNGIVTKYVYGRGFIGEETEGVFKTYHFDYRGSTVAITDASGSITDTFAYDTYGKLSERTGDSTVIFGYNGRDGVVTDANGLIYMRARYYSPELHRFVNADIVKGSISNAVTLNRYAYANGNPASNIDPRGLSAERCGAYSIISTDESNNFSNRIVQSVLNKDGTYSLYDNDRFRDENS